MTQRRQLQDLELEKRVLGQILINPRLYPNASDVLKSDSFHHDPCRIVWLLMGELVAGGYPPSVELVSARIEQRGALTNAGGATFLADLIGVPLGTARIEEFCKMLEELAQMRRLEAFYTAGLERLYSTDLAPAKLQQEAERGISRLSIGAGSYDIRSLGQVLGDTFMPRLKAAMEKIRLAIVQGRPIDDIVPGLPYPIPKLNAKIGGAGPGEQHLIGAFPSVGKSAFAANMVQYLTQVKGVPMGFISLEMEDAEIASRMVAGESENWTGMPMGITTTDLKNPLGLVYDKGSKSLMNPEDSWAYQAVVKSVDQLVDAPLYFANRVPPDWPAIRSAIRRLFSQYKVQGIVIDYLQLIYNSDAGPRANRNEEITRMTNGGKALARELGIPIYWLSQFNRDAQKVLPGRQRRKPRLSDLRDSGAIEQDMDVVIFIHRDADSWEPINGVRPQAELIIAKNRGGATAGTSDYPGTGIMCDFIPELTKFKVPKSKEGDQE